MKAFIYSSLFILLLLCSFMFHEQWQSTVSEKYTIHYQAEQKSDLKVYKKILDDGTRTAIDFTGIPFPQKFEVFIHPNRKSLDSTWQHNWKMPGFKSECWMVASGTGERLDMIAPKNWDKESCEHKYAEMEKTKQLITHELVHVLHGQKNVSSDFSSTEGIDWFVEGLATYASGQCNKDRLKEIKTIVNNKKAPAKLDDFWKGKLKYGLSGSMVMYIDKTYGRKKLVKLLPYSKKNEILQELNTNEDSLVKNWEVFMIKRP